MQARSGLPPPGILYDAGLGASIEQALGLAALYTLEGRGEVRAAAISISRAEWKAALFTEALIRFYLSGGFLRLPLGLSDDGYGRGSNPMIEAVLQLPRSQDWAPFPPPLRTFEDTADNATLLRNALTAYHDGNAVVVVDGRLTNLARMLDVRGAREIAAKKAGLLVVAAGRYSAGAPDALITADIDAARKVFAEWPSPIVVVGEECGESVRFPASAIEKEFGWAEYHPLVAAYRAYHPMPYDAGTRSLAAILCAARPNESGFQLSAPGHVEISGDGATRFQEAANGRVRCLRIDAAQHDRLQGIYVELTSAKPVPRRRPGPPPAKPVPPAKP